MNFYNEIVDGFFKLKYLIWYMVKFNLIYTSKSDIATVLLLTSITDKQIKHYILTCFG